MRARRTSSAASAAACIASTAGRRLRFPEVREEPRGPALAACLGEIEHGLEASLLRGGSLRDPGERQCRRFGHACSCTAPELPLGPHDEHAVPRELPQERFDLALPY